MVHPLSTATTATTTQIHWPSRTNTDAIAMDPMSSRQRTQWYTINLPLMWALVPATHSQRLATAALTSSNGHQLHPSAIPLTSPVSHASARTNPSSQPTIGLHGEWKTELRTRLAERLAAVERYAPPMWLTPHALSGNLPSLATWMPLVSIKPQLEIAAGLLQQPSPIVQLQISLLSQMLP
jgi:hypothetical protein